MKRRIGWLLLLLLIGFLALMFGRVQRDPIAEAGVPRDTPPLGNNLLSNFLDDLRAHHNVLEHIQVDPDGTRSAMPGYHLWATYDGQEHLCTATGQGPISTTAWDCLNISADARPTTGIFCGSTLSTSMTCEEFRGRIPVACIPNRIDLTTTVAPTGAALIVDANECTAPTTCTTLFTTQANRPQIAIGALSGSSTTFDDTSIAQGNYVSFDIDQVGSVVAGSNLTVTLVCE